MDLFYKILKTAVDGGASDVHLKIATPVIYRINRELIAVECPFPTLEWMNSVVNGITPVHLKQKLQDDREIDFSYYVPGIGRFRVNVFRQRGSIGMVLRAIPSIVKTIEEMGLPHVIRKLANKQRGLILLTGSEAVRHRARLATVEPHHGFAEH